MDQEVNNCLILNSFQLKEKEAFMEMIHVMIAFVIIMTMAVGTVALKLYMFPEEKIEGFQPLPQKVIFCFLIVLLRIFLGEQHHQVHSEWLPALWRQSANSFRLQLPSLRSPGD